MFETLQRNLGRLGNRSATRLVVGGRQPSHRKPAMLHEHWAFTATRHGRRTQPSLRGSRGLLRVQEEDAVGPEELPGANGTWTLAFPLGREGSIGKSATLSRFQLEKRVPIHAGY